MRKLGAKKGEKAHRGKQVSGPEFRRMWFDMSMTVRDIAAALGISERSVWARSQARGLPSRCALRGADRCMFDAEFPALWAARWLAWADLRDLGLSASEIAAAFGVDRTSVMHAMKKMGGEL